MSTPGTPAQPFWKNPLFLVELFLLNNIAFLAVDITIAHAINAFANPYEWVPVGFSAVATLVLLLAMALGGVCPLVPDRESRRAPARRHIARWLGLVVGWGAVAVGIAGLIFHLRSDFFEEQTIRNLVYTAPFVAPLAYTGVGLVLILDRMVDARTLDWARWVVLLAMGGFVGNFVLSLADHAQNGFYHPTEWIGVVSAALAAGFLVAVVIAPTDRMVQRWTWAILGLQVLVGILGFALHAWGDYWRPGASLWERVLYGAPIFAPLLFADLAVLAALGLWAIRLTRPETPERVSGLESTVSV